MDHEQRVATALKIKCYENGSDAQTCVFKACALIPLWMSLEEIQSRYREILSNDILEDLSKYREEDVKNENDEDVEEEFSYLKKEFEEGLQKDLLKEQEKDEEIKRHKLNEENHKKKQEELEKELEKAKLRGGQAGEHFAFLTDFLGKTRDQLHTEYSKALKKQSKAAYDSALVSFQNQAKLKSEELVERGKRALTAELMKHVDKYQNDWKPHYETAAAAMQAIPTDIEEGWKDKLNFALQDEKNKASESVKQYLALKAPIWKKDFAAKAKEAASILSSWDALQTKK